jgi:hypothetical protein
VHPDTLNGQPASIVVRDRPQHNPTNPILAELRRSVAAGGADAEAMAWVIRHNSVGGNLIRAMISAPLIHPSPPRPHPPRKPHEGDTMNTTPFTPEELAADVAPGADGHWTHADGTPATDREAAAAIWAQPAPLDPEPWWVDEAERRYSHGDVMKSAGQGEWGGTLYNLARWMPRDGYSQDREDYA